MGLDSNTKVSEVLFVFAFVLPSPALRRSMAAACVQRDKTRRPPLRSARPSPAHAPRRMAASTAACLLDSAPLSHAWLACRLHTRRCMCQILLLLPCLLSVCARTVCPRAMQQAHHRYVGGGFRHREAGDALRYAAGQCSNRLRIPETRGLSLTDFTHAPQDFPAYELKFNLPGRGCILRFDHRIEWCALSLFFASADFTPSACRGSGRGTSRARSAFVWTYVRANR